VDPAAVRDKDGISAAVLAGDLTAALKQRGHTLLDALDDLARRHGVHVTSAVSRQVSDPDEAMGRLRRSVPHTVAGFDVTVTDLRAEAGALRTDAIVLSGGDGETTFRVVVRPSGTEPKIKSYIEVRCRDVSDLNDARARAQRLQDELAAVAARF